MQRLLLALLLTTSLHAATEITWQRKQLHGDFYSEGAAIGDINGDGKPDIVAGPFWWEGPAFETKHAYYEPKIFNINGYSDNFFAYVLDFNGDKKNDILILGFPGKEARLYLNPGVHDDKPWPMSIVADVVDNESPVFTDITGDGKPEIVCSTGGKFGWFAPDWSNPTAKWPFVAVSEDMKVAKFTHGLGVGDVNGDGKLDLLEARRWWEHKDTGLWEQHNFAAGVGGGAQMFAYDFDGNGTNDVFTSLQAHRYGVAIYLQQKKTENGEQRTENGPNWKQIMLASEQPQDNDYGIVFSQPHCAALADINGDGVKDLVVGKRYWAHNGHDPDEHGARVVYWFETKRDGKGGVDFIPHLVDANSGGGTDITVGDVNGDSLPDIVSANKAGVFILTQHRAEISDLKSQISNPLYGPGLKPQSDYAHGQSPTEALKAIQLPTGFKADLIAAEPDIVQPIAFTFDERGRIWVLEGLSYPQPRKPDEGKDRIIILEDKDGDGTYETKTVFCEGISLGSGIELGFGGVWVGAAPYLMFIPRDGDTTVPSNKPDQSHEPYKTYSKVPGLPFTAYALLDGFGSQDTHETLNSFIWGPDGWLYGCHGVFTHSLIGKPGTADKDRTPLNAGIWRYHPVRHVFEIFAEGTSNPWGLDYDQNGEFFVTACVIPHLYHIVPGARYQRQAGQPFNPYTYDDIKTIADHAHYAGNPRPDVTFDKTTGAGVMNNDTNALGGGHAHCGLAIYQSSQFPADYRNKLIFGNLHGHRLVTDYLDPHGSTYIGKHGSDFMRSNDMNFIPVTQKVGPDGSLYVSDWSDKQVCHRGSGAVELWDRSNGRIYKVSYVAGRGAPSAVAGVSDPGGVADGQHPATPSQTGPTKSVPENESIRSGVTDPGYSIPRAPFDLAKESDETLAKLAVQTENEWFSRMARRMLMERATAKGSDQISDAIERLSSPLLIPPFSEPRLLRVQWAGMVTDQTGRSHLNARIQQISPFDSTVLWAIRHMTNNIGYLPKEPDTMIEAKVLGEDDDAKSCAQRSPVLRREMASALQKLPPDLWRENIAHTLLAHGEDKDDPYIPLLIWYGIEPLVGADPKAALELAKASKLPKVTEFIYRRMGAEEAGRTGLLTLASETKDGAMRETLLNTVLLAARAGDKITKPDNWATMRRVFAGFSPSDAASPNASPNGLKSENTLLELEAFMGIEEAKQHFRASLTNDQLSTLDKERAITLLTQVRDENTAPILLEAIARVAQASPPVPGAAGILPADSSGQNARNTGNRQNACPTRAALQALAILRHPRAPEVITTAFPKLSPSEQTDAINTLATTAAGAKALLTAVKAKTIPSTSLSPFLARQIAALKSTELDSLLKETFGDLNAPKADIEERKKKFRAILTRDELAKADKAKGKLLFNAICGQCHQLFGEGQKVGPDLTGSNRGTLDYLLDNVLDPNAVIGKDYQLNIFELNDGRVASGVVKEETPAAFRIAMPGGLEQTITATEVKKRTVAKVSTMPEGLFDALPQEGLQQLVAYLQSNASPDNGKGKPAMKVEGALEGETLKVLETKGGKAKIQGMAGFGNKWSADRQLWWTNAKPGDTLTLALPVEKSGKFALKTVLTKARDYGITDIALDGKTVLSDWDGYNADKVILSDELDLGTHDLPAGEHKLTFTIKGKNPAAVPSHMVGIDYVRLEAR